MADPLPHLWLRVRFEGADFIGPGKAELLERIAASGSIAAAAREMSMSYKRAWSIAEALNGIFDQPLIASSRGGPGKGGAALTPRGIEVLAAYRAIEAAAGQAAAEELARLKSWRRPAKGD